MVIVASFGVAGSASAACPAPVNLVEYDDEAAMLGGGGGTFVQNSQWPAQQFSFPATFEVATVSLFVQNNAPAGDSMTVQLRTDAAGQPGTVLAQATNATTNTATYAFVPFDFSAAGVVLQADTPYWIVARSSETNNGQGYGWQETGSSMVFPNGITRNSLNQGVSWGAPLNQDQGFRVAGCIPSQAAAPPGPSQPTVVVVVNTPARTAVSNAFRLAGTVVSDRNGTATLVVGVPGAGTVAVTPKATVPNSARVVSMPRITKTATAPGAVLVRIKASGRAAKAALRKRRRLAVALGVTYTPRGGTAATKRSRVTLRLRR